MRRIRIAAEAREEYASAFEWYAKRAPDVSADFESACMECLQIIASEPEMHPPVGRGFRRFVMQRFPFAIFYEFSEEQVVIASIFHCARDPRIWKERLTIAQTRISHRGRE